VSYASAWYIWWELNREHLLGIRKTLARTEATSGGENPMDGLREKTRVALRKVAREAREPSLRATALRALGRAGADEDARLFLQVLRSPNQSDEVLEGAAIGLASLNSVRGDDLRAELRRFFDEVLLERIRLPAVPRLITIMTISLRARDDPALVRSLGASCARGPRSANEAAALLFACGLTKDELLGAEVKEAARTGLLGAKRLHDVARSHAILAASATGDAKVATSLLGIMMDRKVGMHSRRSAALALGHLLREGRIDAAETGAAHRALTRVFTEERDPLLVGYATVAMGGARQPFGLDLLMRSVGGTGAIEVRPFAAVALGLAVPHLSEPEAKKVRAFLTKELSKSRDIELAGALSIAAGLADARDARKILLERAQDPRLLASVRGPACQGLGLYRAASPAVEDALLDALRTAPEDVIDDAAIGLGLVGRSRAARLVVETLRETKSVAVQAHLVVALSHLGGTVAIDPLLETLADRRTKFTIRESAAAALGILVDPRENDPLFEIDALSNPYALTVATRELVRVY
jgi:hypothetical protein